MGATVSKIQIIYDDDGTPAFALIPYSQYWQIVTETGVAPPNHEGTLDHREPTVPPQVRARLSNGENPTKVYREWRNLTQDELAAKVGMSSGYISQVERGERTFSRKARANVAAALDVTQSDLDPKQ